MMIYPFIIKVLAALGKDCWQYRPGTGRPPERATASPGCRRN